MSAVIGAESPDGDGSAPTAPTQSSESKPAAPPSQTESCDWGEGRITSDMAGSLPTSASGDFATALIGAWQHTHIDSGSGFEALETATDIRYVFPSASRLLYCQDVTGATNQAENAADISLNGNDIVLPSPATGFTATAWNTDTMVWINNRDGAVYLLKRR